MLLRSVNISSLSFIQASDKNVKIQLDEGKEEQKAKGKKPFTRKDTCDTLASQGTSSSSPGDSGLGSQENIDLDDDEEEVGLSYLEKDDISVSQLDYTA